MKKPAAAKKRKADSNNNGMASTAPNDLFLIECSRKTEMDQYDEDCYEDAYGDETEAVEDLIKEAAQKTDGKWCYTDEGKIVVFDSLANANLFAAEVWDEIFHDSCYDRPVSDTESEADSER